MTDFIQLNGDTLTLFGVRLTFSASSVVEILAFAVLCYYLIIWVKRSQAWSLLKGAVVLLIIYIISLIFSFDNIAFLFEKFFASIVLAIIIILQPELRKALEQLGKRRIMNGILQSTRENSAYAGQLTEESLKQIEAAMDYLSRNRVGALIILENEVNLDDYVDTGIILDAEISTALIEQIFEHNTPLHDGAVIIRNNRILAATCYLPLSQNMDISKELGTRHRAGLGISEVSDSVTLIASEETGNISVAKDGQLLRSISIDRISHELALKEEVKKKRFSLKEWWNGGAKK